MKEIKLNEIKGLRDIKFRDLLEFQAFTELENNTEDDYTFKSLELFYGLDYDTVRALTIEQVELLTNKVAEALKEVPTLQNIITLNGIQYGLIPKFEDITAGELIDMEELRVSGELIELFSILFRPIVGKINKNGEYRIQPYSGYDDKFKDIDAYTANGCLNFFTQSFHILKILTHSSTTMKKEKISKMV